MKLNIAFILLCFLLIATVSSIPVYLMLPLDMVTNDGKIKNYNQLENDIKKIHNSNIAGVMFDCWWGIVQSREDTFNFDAYIEIIKLIEKYNLKARVVLSFHKCGGNVGDTCDIPIPYWARNPPNGERDIFYKDREGHSDEEYLTSGVDHEKLWNNGKTAISLYQKFMEMFAAVFDRELRLHIIDTVEIGMGPCGELRYPSYQLDRWNYCGIGEFQCYDKYLLADLKDAANRAGHPEWGHGGPSNAGTYNNRPYNTGFFTVNMRDNFQSDYGKFFLGWYESKLFQHSRDLLKVSNTVFGKYKIALASKIAGIHWWYDHISHAAELTSGYYNTNNRDAYDNIAKMLNPYNTTFDFTCLEMRTYPNDCYSNPENLVKQAILAAKRQKVPINGENAIELCTENCDQYGFNTIIMESTKYGNIDGFTYLRLTRNLIDRENNWKIFTDFVNKMKSYK